MVICFRKLLACSFVFSAATVALSVSSSADVPVAPTAEVAKKCLIYSYRVYPYKRPGSVKGSPARDLYRRDCIAKGGDVPEPPVPEKPPSPPPRAGLPHQDKPSP